jgi:hypothetical protein
MNMLSIVVLVLVVLLLIQIIEESRKGFRRKWPLGEISNQAYILISVGILSFGVLTLVLAILGYPAGVVLAWILAFLMMANGVWLLLQMLVTTGYFPGGYSAAFVLLGAISLMVVLI